MIPLSYFLVAWVILLMIFGIMTLLTLVQMLRHGLPSPATYVSTLIFLLVTAGVVIGAGIYFSQVDWSQTVAFISPDAYPIFPASVDELPSL